MKEGFLTATSCNVFRGAALWLSSLTALWMDHLAYVPHQPKGMHIVDVDVAVFVVVVHPLTYTTTT